MGFKDKLAGLAKGLPGLTSFKNMLPWSTLGSLERGFIGVLVATLGLGLTLFFGSLFYMVKIAPHQNPFVVGHAVKEALGVVKVSQSDLSVSGELSRKPASESHGSSDGDDEPAGALDHHAHVVEEITSEESQSGDLSENHSDNHHDGMVPTEKTENQASITVQTAIPKSVKDRQDGERESTYDLVDPDIKKEKGLSQLFESKDIDVAVGFRVAELTEIVSGSRAGAATGEAMVYADIALEVDSYELQQEVLNRATEIKSVIAASIGTFEAAHLRTTEGKLELKSLILSEMNRVLKSGRVLDIYYNQLLVR